MIAEWIQDYPVITMIGLCKNAGKTTTMCQLINELAHKTIAVTSIGRDGESTDLVTGTQKPAIWIPKGTFFATATGMLPLCDVTVEVENSTPFATPIGKVAILKARSDGYVQLAGPSIVAHLNTLCAQFFQMGAQTILIDGAAGRKSLAGIVSRCCAILCVGASLSPVMEHAVAETKHVYDLFQWQEIAQGKLRQAITHAGTPFAMFSTQGEEIAIEYEENQMPKIANFPMEKAVLWVAGGVTNGFLKAIAMRGVPIVVVVQDATHLLCDRAVVDAFLRQGGMFAVMKKIDIAAISVNPWSAYGQHYSQKDFVQQLRMCVHAPIVDVQKGEVYVTGTA